MLYPHCFQVSTSTFAEHERFFTSLPGVSIASVPGYNALCVHASVPLDELLGHADRLCWDTEDRSPDKKQAVVPGACRGCPI